MLFFQKYNRHKLFLKYKLNIIKIHIFDKFVTLSYVDSFTQTTINLY